MTESGDKILWRLSHLLMLFIQIEEFHEKGISDSEFSTFLVEEVEPAVLTVLKDLRSLTQHKDVVRTKKIVNLFTGK